MPKKSFLNKKRKAETKFKQKDNIIIAQFEVTEKNEKIKIINSSENAQRNKKINKVKETINNEDEIKDCQIFINGQKVDFNYIFIFSR